MLICDLIDAIKPGSVQYNLLKTSGTPEVGGSPAFGGGECPCVILGEDGQRTVRYLHGTQDRRAHLCAARGHCRNEAEDAANSVRLPDGQ